MTTLRETLASFNTTARKAFGEDTNIVIARCPAYGCADTCMLVFGTNHNQAAIAFASKVKNPVLTIEKQFKFEDDELDTFYTVIVY